MTNYRKTRLAITLGILLFSGAANAGIDQDRLYLAAKGQIPWQSLSHEEQEALRDYRGRWNEYEPDRQQRIREGAKRYQRLPPEKRHEVDKKRQEYEKLSPQERQRLREEYRRQHK
jgi:hypothetical protein